MVAGCDSGMVDERAEWVAESSDPVSDVVAIKYLHGGCSRYLRTDVSEARTEVHIDVIVRTDENANCDASLHVVDHVVHLQDALGTRALVGECTSSSCQFLKPPPTTATG